MVPDAELLGRPEVAFDLEPCRDYLRDKVVMVTGGGGSIGAELCREILRSRASKLIALDWSEQALYEFDEQLGRPSGGPNLSLVLADVTQHDRMDAAFRSCRPDLVLHAAAYKHVRYVEENPEAGVVNNVGGTWSLLQLCLEHDIRRFVLISSDKAVNPVSVMGATKRLCELLVLDLARREKTELVAVRFGNVLRTRGSLIPKLERLVQERRPITLRDPRAERYFMSMREAVGLVLHSAVAGQSGDICTQRMGRPVSLADIARRVVTGQGLSVEDVPMAATQLLPGERVSEKLLSSEEEARVTDRGGILALRPCAETRGVNYEALQELLAVASQSRPAQVLQGLRSLVPEYGRMAVGNAPRRASVAGKPAGDGVG